MYENEQVNLCGGALVFHFYDGATNLGIDVDPWGKNQMDHGVSRKDAVRLRDFLNEKVKDYTPDWLDADAEWI